MCDTMVVVLDGEVLFAKNSDRDPNEAQPLDWQPRRAHPAGATVRCTHIEIPQVAETAAVLLSRPFWMWGAEMGANEHGVVIGNEAVFTTEPRSDTGLTGMDLLRLALERSSSGAEAVETITALLADHGQGGGCGFEDRSFTYHNSFLVADASGGWVLETAGGEWAVEEVVEGARTISNGLTISDFAARYSDRLRTRVSACRIRQPRTTGLAAGVETVADLAAILRDHGGDPWPSYRRLNGTLHMPCMHGGSEIASSLSAGSWLSRLRPGEAHHWATATSSPCLSLFKPVAVGEELDLGAPEGTVDDSLWWTHERLHRRVMADPGRLAGPVIAARDECEREWFSRPPASADAFAEHRRLLNQWLEAVPMAERDTRPGFTRRYWAKRDRQAGLA